MTNGGPKEARQTSLRQLPSIDNMLRSPQAEILLEKFGHALTAEAFRSALSEQRLLIKSGQVAFEETDLLRSAEEWLTALLIPDLCPVINATGIIIHTNLGRAPLSKRALAAVEEAGGLYSTLEYDLSIGGRGSRAAHPELLICRLTGAEAALVVNNNAAAVLLMLTALSRGKRVVISRGQLVEIGGGFRIPDVMSQSGAELVEVGTTNRTHLRDYESAINDNTSAILVAHHSNYRIVGFTSEPSLAELAELAGRFEIPLLYDQGSGALLDVSAYGLDPEPTVQEGLSSGCDVVAFSGDKLLGGPQAGILCGRSELIDRMRRHPLARAVRADKMCLAALGATLTSFLSGRAAKEIPIWKMISRSLEGIEADARAWASHLSDAGVQIRLIEGESLIGGGSLPGTSLPTLLVAVDHGQLERFAASMRADTMPVIGRIQDELFLMDPRTVLPGQGEALLETVKRSWLATVG